MSIRLKVAADHGEHAISAQVELPTDSSTFTMSPRGARQLAQHLLRLADLTEGEEG